MIDILNIAKDVFKIEREQIEIIENELDENFILSVQAMNNTNGKVVIIGMGKSGLIGRKISATLSSTGTASIFLHPAEAYHGDLGAIEKKRDIALLISYSGETDEVIKLLPFLEWNENIIISMTGNKNSTLARYSKYHLFIGVKQEACPLQLAPTSSTTVSLIMGDALAVALMKLKNFQAENFARFHPGGSLGRRLITKVGDLMRKDNLPIIKIDSPIDEVIHVISQGKLGLAVILDTENNIFGIITDGDIRRAMENHRESFFNLKAENIATRQPKIISADTKIIEAENIFNKSKINSLLVGQDKKLVGILQIYNNL